MRGRRFLNQLVTHEKFRSTKHGHKPLVITCNQEICLAVSDIYVQVTGGLGRIDQEVRVVLFGNFS
jgi:hypothetical protein